MISKILFIDLFNEYSPIDESIGQASISALLRQNGYHTKLVAYKENKIDYNEILDYMPDIIGFSVQPRTVLLVNEVSRNISKTLPHTYIAIGGYLPTNNTNEIFDSIIDLNFAIRGEGEYTFLKLINTINENQSLYGVEGLSFKVNNNIIHNKDRKQIENLDVLPFPDRDIIIKHNIHIARVEGARGCSSACSFCSIHGFWSNGHSKDCISWRSKSIERFIDEIEYLASELNISRFHILDSSFENPHYNYDRINKIANEIVKRNLNITYYINMRSDFYKFATDELLTLLIDSGLNTIFIGAESFNAEDLRLYNKQASVDDSIKTIELLNNYSIKTDLGFINFHPYSTIEGLYNNAQLLCKYGFSSRLLLRNKLMVFKGTALYTKMKNDHLFEGEFYEIKNYKFVTEKVSTINSYIENVIKEKNNMNDNILIKLDLYEHRHLSLIVHLKHYFKKIMDYNALLIVDEYEKNLRKLLNELNIRNTQWFLSLLDLISNKWDEDIADHIIETHIGDEYLNNLLKEFNKNNLILYNKLVKINKKYLILL